MHYVLPSLLLYVDFSRVGKATQVASMYHLSQIKAALVRTGSYGRTISEGVYIALPGVSKVGYTK